MTSTIPQHQKLSETVPVVNNWLASLPPDKQALVICYVSALTEEGIPEQVALEIIYKTILYCVANGGKR
jgi:hypothetical protein